jgi:hypothetical protein
MWYNAREESTGTHPRDLRRIVESAMVVVFPRVIFDALSSPL